MKHTAIFSLLLFHMMVLFGCSSNSVQNSSSIISETKSNIGERRFGEKPSIEFLNHLKKETKDGSTWYRDKDGNTIFFETFVSLPEGTKPDSPVYFTESGDSLSVKEIGVPASELYVWTFSLFNVEGKTIYEETKDYELTCKTFEYLGMPFRKTSSENDCKRFLNISLAEYLKNNPFDK